MKQILVSAVVAAIVGIAVVYGFGRTTRPEAATEPTAGPTLHYTDALPEDVWIDGSRTAGDDHRALTDSANSICFITKIELSGIQSPDDTSSCALEIDEFTGYWDLVATVKEGGKSSIRCNARCLTLE
jgi:hypothetical protein